MFLTPRFQNRRAVSSAIWKIRTRSLNTGKRDGEKAPRLMRLFEMSSFVGRNVALPAFLMFISDMLEQHLENLSVWGEPLPREQLDLKRTKNMSIVGGLMGPLQYYGYKHMDRLIPGHTLRTVLKKIIADQLIMSPLSILLFFCAACFLEGESLKESIVEMKHKFLRIYLMDWMFWPPVQFLNFRYLDTSMRVMYVGFATAIYNVMLSYIKHVHEDIK